MGGKQLEEDATDILNDLQTQLLKALDELSGKFGKRYVQLMFILFISVLFIYVYTSIFY